MFIYKITNKINSKTYIGQTVQPLNIRWGQHKNSSSGCRALKMAIKKYGSENFQIEILEECSSLKELNQREERLIKSFNSLAPNGYNLLSGGLNKRHSRESRELIGSYHKGKEVSDKTKEKLRRISSGKRHSEETKEKCRQANKKRVYKKGFKHNPTTRKKMSQAAQKRPVIGKNLVTGREIFYDSIIDAEKDGFYRANICHVLSGRYKHHKGFHWRYK